MQKMQEEKNARLKQFREDVKHRVSLLEKARKQKLQDNTYKAVSLYRCISLRFIG